MSNNNQASKPPLPRHRKTGWRWVWRAAILAAIIGGIFAYFHKGEKASVRGTTFQVRRGPLQITVLEGGSLEAMESQEIKSQVQGQTKILSIVEEGYTVTQEDVDKGKVLVELDSKDLQDRKIAEELDFQNAASTLTEVTEEFSIQANQNRSDISSAQLAAKFARMDFERYMGVDSAKEILTKLKLCDVDLESVPEIEYLPEPTIETLTTKESEASNISKEKTNGDTPKEGNVQEKPETNSHDSNVQKEKQENNENMSELPPETKEETERINELRAAHAALDFTKYANADSLGDGEAKQKLRKFEDDYILAEKELVLSKTQFEGTKRLAQKDFVTKNDLENERLKTERNQIALESAQTAKDLFIKYEFVKMSEKYLSDFEDSLAKLERTKKLARSKMTQASAKRRSAEKRFNIQTSRLREINEQLDKCKIRAKRPGLVVYANPESWRDDDQIREGSLIRERQDIISIPDLSEMAAKVKIHEASIKFIQKGQKVKITVDAYPDEKLTGEVVQVAILPDSENRWMNPDVKVYEVKIRIDGKYDWVKPGMTAQIEIFVKEIANTIYVPIQAIVPSDGEKISYVVHGISAPEKRVVTVGDFNNEFIEVKSGLSEGETVLLRAPMTPEDADKGGDKKKGDKKEDKEKSKAKKDDEDSKSGDDKS